MHTFTNINNIDRTWEGYRLPPHDVTASIFKVAAAHAADTDMQFEIPDGLAEIVHTHASDQPADDGLGALIWLVRLMRR